MEIGEDREQHQTVAGRILRNFGFLTVGKLLGDVLTFLMFVTLSRVYGQEGIGEYSFAMALTSFLMILADYGFTDLSIKHMSRYRERMLEYYSEVLTLRIFLVLIAMLVLYAVAELLVLSERAWQVLILVGVFQILFSVLEGVGSIFIASEKMFFKGVIEFSAKGLSALICILVVSLKGGLAESLVVLPVLTVLHIIVAHIILSARFGRIKIGLTYHRAREILRESTSYASFVFLSQLATRIDVVLIGFMMGAAAAGVYNVAYRVIFLLLFLPYFGAMSILPLASRLFKDSKFDLEILYHNSLNLAVLVGMPIAFGVWLIAPEFITTVFGNEFESSAGLLRMLAVILLFSCLNSLIGVFLTASDRQQVRTRCQWISALVNMVANLALIPLLGLTGAAFAAILSEVLLTALLVTNLYGDFGVPRIGYRAIVAITGVLAFCVPMELLKVHELYILIPVSILVYVGVLLLFRDIRHVEGTMLLTMVRKANKQLA
ncbi:MAG: flippase [Gammaproteobacteria bacterium]|nr:flippase [Gammaproteobacteria bacterium]